MTEMISFGAGVNSVAMTIMLVNDGWHGPIVFADPGAEHPDTYCYIEYFEREWLKPRGLEVTRISPATHPELYDDKRLGGLADTLEEYCLMRGVIPLGAVRWCTVQFKVNPLNNWKIQHGIARANVGFTVDEGHRERRDDTNYPLDDRQITRPECHRIIYRAGLDAPRKSGCFFCPGQPLADWRELCLNHPGLYERAIKLEENASKANQKWATLDPHGISLEQHRSRRWEGLVQFDLSEWIPCMCRL